MTLELFSTSSFLRGTQCEKSLFLNVYYPELRDKVAESSVPKKQRRVTIAKLTRHLFPEGVFAGIDVTGSCEDSYELTRKHLQDGVTTIFNACFKHEDIFCLVDVLNRENGYWKAYGIWDFNDPDDHVILTGAMQYFIIKRCGVRVDDYLSVIYKTHLDSEKKVHMDYDIKSVRERIVFLQDQIEEKLSNYKKVLKKKKIPSIPVGEHCRFPKICDYFEYCRFSTNRR